MFLVIPIEVSRQEKTSCYVNNRTMFIPKKEEIFMIWGFHGMWLLMPLLLLSKLFWILIYHLRESLPPLLRLLWCHASILHINTLRSLP